MKKEEIEEKRKKIRSNMQSLSYQEKIISTNLLKVLTHCNQTAFITNFTIDHIIYKTATILYSRYH